MVPMYVNPEWCYYLDEENNPNGYVGHKCEKNKPFMVYEIFIRNKNKYQFFSSKCLNCKTEINKTLIFQIKLLG